MDWLNQLVTVVNDFLWTNIVIVMLVGIGLLSFATVLTNNTQRNSKNL